VLERRKKTEIPIFLPMMDSLLDLNPLNMNSITSLDLSKNQEQMQSKMVLTKQQIVSYFNSQLTGLTIENFEFDVLFKNIKLNRLIVLIEAMLLEKKIILVHHNHGVLAVIIECLKALIRPLKWCGSSSSFMIGPGSFEFMDSPFGFIYGFSRKTWDRDIVMNVDQAGLDEYFFEDSVILEIDKDYLRTKLEPIIPNDKRTMIVTGIQKLLNSKEEMISSFNSKYPHLYSLKYEQLFWKSFELRVKRLFLNFFVTTINNYLGFYKTEEEIAQQKVIRAGKIFDFEKYVNQYPKEERLFMEQLVNTQSFCLFIENSYGCECDADTKYFIQTIQSLEKQKFPSVDPVEKAYAHPIKYDYDHCLKEYTGRLNQVKFGDQDLNESISNYEFFDKQKILEMPGIDYEKINIYREAKKHKKFTSMENLPDPNNLEPNSVNDQTFKYKKNRYKSI
jgi:hypothetical protein